MSSHGLISPPLLALFQAAPRCAHNLGLPGAWLGRQQTATVKIRLHRLGQTGPARTEKQEGRGRGQKQGQALMHCCCSDISHLALLHPFTLPQQHGCLAHLA
jgi:hypothetical protein